MDNIVVVALCAFESVLYNALALEARVPRSVRAPTLLSARRSVGRTPISPILEGDYVRGIMLQSDEPDGHLAQAVALATVKTDVNAQVENRLLHIYPRCMVAERGVPYS